MSATLEKTLTRAHQDWISRPDDERYLSLDDLHEATATRAQECLLPITRIRRDLDHVVEARRSASSRA